MKKQFIVYSLWLIAVFALVLPITTNFLPTTAYAVAQIGIKQPSENAGVIVGNSSADTLLGGIFRNAITLIFTVASVSAVIMFLWGAVKWILSGGDKEAIAAARKKIVAALVGLVILALSFLVLSLVGVFVGINPLKNLKIPGLGDNLGVSTTQKASELRKSERSGN
jgi:hypothetical protein